MSFFFYLCYFWKGGHSGDQGVDVRKKIRKHIGDAGCEDGNWLEQEA
jgi:hypothetical protein